MITTTRMGFEPTTSAVTGRRSNQLGEHLPYKQRVTGSSPVGPINFADLAQWQSS